MKNFFLLLFLFPFALVADDELFVIGTTSGFAPYVSLDADGKYEGFDIDVAQHVAKKLNKQIKIKDYGNMPGLIMAMNQDRVDAIIWAISITQERMQQMNMVYYHGDKMTTMPFLFWKEVPAGITTIEALEAMQQPVCVEAGTSQEKALKRYPTMKIKYFDKIVDVIMDLKAGKSLATTTDPSLITRYQGIYPEIKVAQLPLHPEDYTLGYGICLKKTNLALTEQVKKAVDELRTDGTITKLEQKWKMVSH